MVPDEDITVVGSADVTVEVSLVSPTIEVTSTLSGGGGLANPMTALGDLIQGGTAGVPVRLADVATGNVLISGGVGVAFAWGKVGISTHVSGLGTGIATALAINTGSAGAPVLFNGAGGTPTSLTLTNATALPVTGITATGTPSSTTYLRGDGTWGTPAGGFTNPMTTAGDIIYGATSGVPTRLATGTGLLHAGTTPSWSLVSLTADVSGVLPGTNGGTGVNNSTRTMTYAGNIAFAGAFAQTFTATATTTVTLPTTGTLATIAGSEVFTNKRITPRVTTTTSTATPTINTDNIDIYGLTAQAVAITSFTTNLSGTPTNGQALSVYIIPTGTNAIAWGASFEAGAAPLPTTTSGTTRLDVLFVWNTATGKWRCMASSAPVAGGGDMLAATYDPAGIAQQLVGTTASQTLTNKRFTLILDSNGANAIGVGATASAVNYPLFTNAAAGSYPAFTAAGTDTNIGFDIAPKGTGPVRIYTTTGNQPTLAAAGADTNLNLVLTPKGTGWVAFPNANITQTGTGSATPQILVVNDTSSANTALFIKDNTNFAYTSAPLVVHQLVNSSDSSIVLLLQNSGTGKNLSINNGTTETASIDKTGKVVSTALQINTSTPAVVGYVWTATDTSGNASWQVAPGSGGGMTNPMTTAGDIIYGGAAGVATRLATGTGFLRGGSTPAYSAIGLASADVTGTLAAGNGGTGITALGTGIATALALAVNGSGAISLTTSPAFTTPSLGVATATSINKVTITAPTTSATLTLVTGSSLITVGAFALTLTSTATTNSTLPAGTHTLAGLDVAQTWSAVQTANLSIYTPQAITVTTNAGTADVTHLSQKFTNSSAAAMTITLATASAVDGQTKIVRIYDFSAVAQGITWVNTENSAVTPPATSAASTTLPLTVAFVYNGSTSKWRCVASV